MSELLLIAASGLAREVMALVRRSGQYDILGILDDDEELTGVEVDGARFSDLSATLPSSTRRLSWFVWALAGPVRQWWTG
ncbi:conserved hypothetical protein [Arthrobacter sp. Hiyo6]|nr:conserved hypothetical protein [Arthrobacter sp. Hiyo6]